MDLRKPSKLVDILRKEAVDPMLRTGPMSSEDFKPEAFEKDLKEKFNIPEKSSDENPLGTIGSSGLFTKKLPSINTRELYKDQTRAVNDNWKDLDKLRESYGWKPYSSGIGPAMRDVKTPAAGSGPIAPLSPPPLESPPFNVAPPAGNVFPNERPVALNEAVRKEASFVGTIGRTALGGIKNTRAYRGVAAKLARNPELAWRLDRAALIGSGLALGGAGVALNQAVGSYDKMPNIFDFSGK